LKVCPVSWTRPLTLVTVSRKLVIFVIPVLIAAVMAG
jgi:hypothetical protein